MKKNGGDTWSMSNLAGLWRNGRHVDFNAELRASGEPMRPLAGPPRAPRSLREMVLPREERSQCRGSARNLDEVTFVNCGDVVRYTAPGCERGLISFERNERCRCSSLCSCVYVSTSKAEQSTHASLAAYTCATF